MDSLDDSASHSVSRMGRRDGPSVGAKRGPLTRPRSTTCGRPCSSGILSTYRQLFPGSEYAAPKLIQWCCPDICPVCGGNSTHKCDGTKPKWCCPFEYGRVNGKMKLKGLPHLNTCTNSSDVNCLMPPRNTTSSSRDKRWCEARQGARQGEDPGQPAPAPAPVTVVQQAEHKGKGAGKGKGIGNPASRIKKLATKIQAAQ